MKEHLAVSALYRTPSNLDSDFNQAILIEAGCLFLRLSYCHLTLAGDALSNKRNSGRDFGILEIKMLVRREGTWRGRSQRQHRVQMLSGERHQATTYS